MLGSASGRRLTQDHLPLIGITLGAYRLLVAYTAPSEALVNSGESTYVRAGIVPLVGFLESTALEGEPFAVNHDTLVDDANTDTTMEADSLAQADHVTASDDSVASESEIVSHQASTPDDGQNRQMTQVAPSTETHPEDLDDNAVTQDSDSLPENASTDTTLSSKASLVTSLADSVAAEIALDH
eukprot:5266014-Amphidinium_carterae.1